jgi:hypothetical protein
MQRTSYVHMDIFLGLFSFFSCSIKKILESMTVKIMDFSQSFQCLTLQKYYSREFS